MYVYEVMSNGSLNLRLHFLKMNQEFCGQKNIPLPLNCSQTLLIWFKEIQKYTS